MLLVGVEYDVPHRTPGKARVREQQVLLLLLLMLGVALHWPDGSCTNGRVALLLLRVLLLLQAPGRM